MIKNYIPLKKVLFFLILVAGLWGALLPEYESEADDREKPVHVLTMDGAIGPAFAAYLESGIDKAAVDNAQLLVIELDTPGGLLSTTREMVSMIVEAPMPVAVWTTPTGGHAASAGTFIMYAAHVAAMDEGTNIGAATPIKMRGQTDAPAPDENTEENKEEKTEENAQDGDSGTAESDLKKLLENMRDPNQEAMQQKAIEDTAAFIRGLAELRGRNADWAEKAVTEADSLTAAEALAENVIDLIATSREDLLTQLDGRTLTLKDDTDVTLATAAAPLVVNGPDWKTRFLALITDPNVAFILMSIGVYGLILEFYNPGSLIPGTIGAISLVIGLYAMNVLPVNAAGVVLLLLGLGFMVMEAFIPSFGILGVGGLTAFVIGATIMFETENMPGLGLDWGVIWGMALLGALVIALVMALTYKVYRQKVTTGTENMIGEPAWVEDWNGAAGRVFIQGETWQAWSETDLGLKENDKVRVVAVEGLKLKIEAD